MNDPRSKALDYAKVHRQDFLNQLVEFIAIPSISTDPNHKSDMQRAAEWVVNQFNDLDMTDVHIYPTPGHPVIYGKLTSKNPSAMTVLVYGHYDVQPPEPLELWKSPPFNAQVRQDNLYGRGATDMKGQILAALKAVESILNNGDLPVNIKFLIEGEEEIGSPHLTDFIADHKELLSSDLALNPDSGFIMVDMPTITYALRGMAYFELRIFGPDHDLHSGTYGGVVHNPAQVLCELIAGMHDDQGRVTLSGFYDRVRSLDEEERSELAKLPMNEAFYLDQTHAPALWGEAGYTPVERTGARPTLEINGILSGFTDEGIKTVLPAWSMAKISTRLVPDQDPQEVFDQLESYLQANAPKTVRYKLTNLVHAPASISDRHSQGVEAMSKAMESVWGKPPVFKREGGSVPVVSQLQGILGIESVNSGFSLQEDHMHSPNEKIHLPTWYRGIDTYINFFYNLGS
jgi:acetylornithine deacetylase/succinyl-diaminopimelate desuccinylase-like protein